MKRIFIMNKENYPRKVNWFNISNFGRFFIDSIKFKAQISYHLPINAVLLLLPFHSGHYVASGVRGFPTQG